ncbi:MAG: hypothetical protein IPJ82_19555, partial [Lewinellaceae bacterium]|nr:hypothetical protein [Lewinellaceae bacterium]
ALKNLLSDRYPEGCVLAYVVQGKSENVIKGINRLIESRKIKTRVGLIQKDNSVPFPVCYASDHVLISGERTIWHLFCSFKILKQKSGGSSGRSLTLGKKQFNLL